MTVFRRFGSKEQLVRAAIEKDDEDPPGIATSIPSLFHGDVKAAEGRIRTQPGKFSIAGAGPRVGRGSGEPVTNDYPGSAPTSSPTRRCAG